ncbi:hypothetical protein GCM10010232_62540 [Streptomyces amakusaensis]
MLARLVLNHDELFDDLGESSMAVRGVDPDLEGPSWTACDQDGPRTPNSAAVHVCGRTVPETADRGYADVEPPPCAFILGTTALRP